MLTIDKGEGVSDKLKTAVGTMLKEELSMIVISLSGVKLADPMDVLLGLVVKDGARESDIELVLLLLSL